MALNSDRVNKEVVGRSQMCPRPFKLDIMQTFITVGIKSIQVREREKRFERLIGQHRSTFLMNIPPISARSHGLAKKVARTKSGNEAHIIFRFVSSAIFRGRHTVQRTSCDVVVPASGGISVRD